MPMLMLAPMLGFLGPFFFKLGVNSLYPYDLIQKQPQALYTQIFLAPNPKTPTLAKPLFSLYYPLHL